MKIVHFVKMKFFMLTLAIALLFTPFAFSHGDGDGHDESSVLTTSAASPFKYLNEGNYLGAALVVVMWLVIIKGIYELTLMVLSKHIK